MDRMEVRRKCIKGTATEEEYNYLLKLSGENNENLKEIGVKKSLAATDNKTKVKDCLWYTEGLFKDWYERSDNK